MPFLPPDREPSDAPQRYTAVVAVPTWNATKTIEATLTSVAESVRFYQQGGGTGRVAISVVDDASTDATVELIGAFARTCAHDLHLSVNPAHRGRAWGRNRALAAVDADYFLFLDHDDEYLPEHIQVCLDALERYSRVDYVKTGVALSDPVHPEWEPGIAAALTQNLCVRARCHRLIGGFQEEPEVETYGCDDLLYNRTLRAYFRGLEVRRRTVRFFRRPGNSFDRQYDRKFTRPVALADVTLSAAQQQVAPRVSELLETRQQEVRTRLESLGVAARGGRPARGAIGARRSARTSREQELRAVSLDPGPAAAPFGDRGPRIYAMLVTGKSPERVRLARASVRSFLAQSYGNRALVIVNDGDLEVDTSGVPSDRVVQLRPAGRRSLGALRNLALDAVSDGALWTYWDDDDWRHPSLLTAQQALLARLDLPACFLANQIKYSLADHIAFVDHHPGGFAGSLLAVKHPRLRFPDARSGEDSVYTAELKREWRWYPWNNPPHYLVRLFHGANTWDAAHFGFTGRAPGDWRVSAVAAHYLWSVLPLYGNLEPPTSKSEDARPCS